MKKIAFLGSGNMASAMVGGILSRGIATKDELICLGGKGVTAEALAERTGIALAFSLDQLLAEASTLVIAFKPYNLATSDKKLAELTSGKLVVSVLAGKKLSQLAQFFPKARALFRCMPNTPSRIGSGVTGWCTTAATTQADRSLAVSLLQSLGVAIEVDEAQMDALTAVSGCGPAYVFEFAAALREAGIAAGLTKETAHILAVETLLGSAKLLAERGVAPETLRDEVTSPNGVTFAGLKRLEAGQFRDLLRQTVLTAKARAEELSKDA